MAQAFTLVQNNSSREAVLLSGAPVSAVAWDHRADKILLVGTKGKGVKACEWLTSCDIANMPLSEQLLSQSAGVPAACS